VGSHHAQPKEQRHDARARPATGEPIDEHQLANCPCRPRLQQIHRDDDSVETLTLDWPFDDDAN
jgi:hypothetical protein